MADYNTLKEKVTIQQALDWLNIKLRRDGPNLRGSCPICHEGGDRVFKAFTSTNTFYCWSCKKSGTIIDLVAGVTECDQPTAGRKLEDAFDIKSPPRKSENGSTKFDPEKWGKGLDPAAYQLAPLGLAPEVYRAFGAGYNATKPSLKGMLCVPIRQPDGTLLGFVGVHVETRELAFPKPAFAEALLNCDRVTPGTLHVVTHPLGVLRQIETGIEELANVVAIMTTITPAVLDNLTAFARERGVETIEFH